MKNVSLFLKIKPDLLKVVNKNPYLCKINNFQNSALSSPAGISMKDPINTVKWCSPLMLTTLFYDCLGSALVLFYNFKIAIVLFHNF